MRGRNTAQDPPAAVARSSAQSERGNPIDPVYGRHCFRVEGVGAEFL